MENVGWRGLTGRKEESATDGKDVEGEERVRGRMDRVDWVKRDQEKDSSGLILSFFGGNDRLGEREVKGSSIVDQLFSSKFSSLFGRGNE